VWFGRAVGKSSLCVRYVKDSFNPDMESTVGAAFHIKTVQTGDYTLRLEIWDTAGQERYQSLTPMYYRGAAAAIIVYDITNKGSYIRAKKWVEDLRAAGDGGVGVLYLAGNKQDLPDHRRKVDTQEAQRYAEKAGILFSECSAKTGFSIAGIFKSIAAELPEIAGLAAKPEKEDVINLTVDEDQKRRGCCK